MTTVTIDAGTLTANREERIVTGLLLPFGEDCKSNLGKFRFEPGAVTVPRDLTGMSFNVEHARENPIGAPVALTSTAAGIVGTFKVADTPEGDTALDDIATGRRRRLSAEVAGVKIRNGIGIAGRLFAAALVEKSAFPSATLLAAEDTLDDEDDEDTTEPTTTEEHNETTFTDENGVTWSRVMDVETTTEENKTTTTMTVVEETEEPETPVENEGEPDVATVPNTLTASKGQTTAAPAKVDLRTLYAAMAEVKAGNQGEALTLLAALSDIKISGTGALPAAGVIRDNWVGQLWDGKSYERKFINLGTLGTDISAGGKNGFKIHRGTKAAPKTMLGGDWAGNKTEVPTGSAWTETFKSSLDRFAFAADIAREFYDLPGGTEVIEAFLALIVEDYALWSDLKALGKFLEVAGTPVAPKTYPTEFSGSLGQLVQGILAVNKKDTASFAIVNDAAYEELMYTPKDLIPEYIDFTFNTEGTGTADSGKVVVVNASEEYAAEVGFPVNSPAVLVGARPAIQFDEVGSTPINIDALEIARGGVDRAVHGYVQTFVVNPSSLVLVGAADAA